MFNSLLMLGLSLMLLLSGCTYAPEKAQPVQNFDVQRYLGTWYEVARFDFFFEKDMDNTSAQYRLDEQGNVVVLNSGYHTIEQKWKKADGLAKFRGDTRQAALKVSFFGPFYAGYNVLALDENYQYALIAGKSLDYLWILSRSKTLPEDIKQQYLTIAHNVGYDTSKLIWVEHNRSDNPFLSE